jgi:Tfp pilus assembly protein PilF
MKRPLVLSLFISLLFTLIGCAGNGPKKKDPEQRKAELYYSYGTQKLVRGDHAGALDNLLKAQKLMPKDADINNNLGMAYYLRGDTKRAIHYINYSLDLKPNNPDALNNLASLHFQQKNYKRAREVYEDLLKNLTYKKQFRTHYNLGLIYLREGNVAKATKNFHKSLDIFSDYCPAHYELGMIAKGQGKLEEARKAFVEGIKGVCFEGPASHYQLAMVLIEQKKFIQAQKKLEEFVERFSRTSYFPLASQKLSELKNGQYDTLNYSVNDIDSSSPFAEEEGQDKGPTNNLYQLPDF